MAINQTLNGAIADRVRGACKAAGITQQDLALRIGVPDRTFDRLLTGEVDWKVTIVAKVADATGDDLVNLLTGEAA